LFFSFGSVHEMVVQFPLQIVRVHFLHQACQEVKPGRGRRSSVTGRRSWLSAPAMVAGRRSWLGHKSSVPALGAE
jgi:hypothetical protein